MKNSFSLVVFLFLFNLISAQPTRIKFDYDNEGNQTQRYICPTCNAKMVPIDSIRNATTLTENDMIKDELYHQISYYPNPVLQELYVKWKNEESKYVSSIEVYTLAGQSMQQFSNLKENDMATIGFLNYPNGFYNVVLFYNNGERKTLKIVKK